MGGGLIVVASSRKVGTWASLSIPFMEVIGLAVDVGHVAMQRVADLLELTVEAFLELLSARSVEPPVESRTTMVRHRGAMMVGTTCLAPCLRLWAETFLVACALTLAEIDAVRGFARASALCVRRGRRRVPDSPDAEQIAAPVIEAAREFDHLHLRQGPGQIVGSAGPM